MTVANRGIGVRFVEQLLAEGAQKVYAGARRPDLVDVSDSRVVPLHLNLLDDTSIGNRQWRAPRASRCW